MIAEALIREALTPPRPAGVTVRPYIRKRPGWVKVEAKNAELRAALAGGKR